MTNRVEAGMPLHVYDIRSLFFRYRSGDRGTRWVLSNLSLHVDSGELVGIHRNELFDRMHVEILPGVFLFAALGLWLAWTSWVRPVPAR